MSDLIWDSMKRRPNRILGTKRQMLKSLQLRKNRNLLRILRKTPLQTFMPFLGFHLKLTVRTAERGWRRMKTLLRWWAICPKSCWPVCSKTRETFESTKQELQSSAWSERFLIWSETNWPQEHTTNRQNSPNLCGRTSRLTTWSSASAVWSPSPWPLQSRASSNLPVSASLNPGAIRLHSGEAFQPKWSIT